MHQVIRPDGLYRAQQRFGMYRWHGPDPVHFATSLRVTVQDLGWRRDGRYLPRRDDLASTAFWYLAAPGGRPRRAPALDELEVGSLPLGREVLAKAWLMALRKDQLHVRSSSGLMKLPAAPLRALFLVVFQRGSERAVVRLELV
jgi:hypothetical protein